ncbi:MAG: hypothetical protein AABY03_00405 [Nanoarchaeota archaeon]
MSEGEDIEISRGILRDYHTTLNGIYVMFEYSKNSVEYEQLKKIVSDRLSRIEEISKIRKQAVHKHFEYNLSDEEISHCRGLLSKINIGETTEEDKKILKDKLLKIATLSELRKYTN